MTNKVLYKPYIGCLLIHQPAWECIGIMRELGRDVFECIHCKVKFLYPTKQDEEPVYRKS